jgi:hypothetical protein
MGKLKEEFKGRSLAYGNGTVYLSDGSEVIELHKHNFRHPFAWSVSRRVLDD